MGISILKERCIFCGACAIICPQGAITLEKDGAQVDSSRCTRCRLCVCKCYTRAIRITKDFKGCKSPSV